MKPFWDFMEILSPGSVSSAGQVTGSQEKTASEPLGVCKAQSVPPPTAAPPEHTNQTQKSPREVSGQSPGGKFNFSGLNP